MSHLHDVGLRRDPLDHVYHDDGAIGLPPRFGHSARLWAPIGRHTAGRMRWMDGDKE